MLTHAMFSRMVRTRTKGHGTKRGVFEVIRSSIPLKETYGVYNLLPASHYPT